VEPFRIAALGSSSQGGNTYLVEHCSGTRLLVDCGVRLRRTVRALDELAVDPKTLGAILLTHEHQDHVCALKLKHPLPAHYGIPVYATRGTWYGLRRQVGPLHTSLRRVIPVGQLTIVAGLQVFAFATSHDVSESVGYVISDGVHRVGIATDLGCAGAETVECLRGCEYLVVESNHDVQLLEQSARPYFLKQRILGDRGHLSNNQAANLLAQLVVRSTRLVALAHLSVECNTPGKALSTVSSRLRGTAFNGCLVAARRLGSSGWLETL